MSTTQNPANASMPDMQSSADPREIAIDRVGVRKVVYPIRLRTRAGGEQGSIADISMYVALPHTQKGTHMSRFIEVLESHACEPITPEEFPGIARAIRDRLNAKEAHIEASFVYFVKKKAPVTGIESLMDYKVTFSCTANGDDDFIMTVAAPATSLCPCSKEISEYGAHNQRCEITASVRFTGEMWIEDLVEICEGASSLEVFALLKRPDEKYVTEHAYDNPKFVEDIIRDLAIALDKDDRVRWYAISSENFESIHSHNAYAELERSKGK
ncbi:MAG: GTP cyclohydrolase FolE2 [Phycisphaerales bacterium]